MIILLKYLDILLDLVGKSRYNKGNEKSASRSMSGGCKRKNRLVLEFVKE